MTKVVAEIGCNHMGSLDFALSMVHKIITTSPDISYIKFQKRTPSLYHGGKWDLPHPNPQNAFGKTYKEHRSYLELGIEDHRILKKYINSKGVGYSCSVWDVPAFENIISLGVDYLKIPSALNNDLDFLDLVIEQSHCPIHISLGMLDRSEIDYLFKFLDSKNALNRTIAYACTTGYPVPDEELALLELVHLKETYGKSVLGLGFSGHHQSIAPDIAAYTIGASWIERHYSASKQLKGTDQKASLQAEDFSTLTKYLLSAKKSLNTKNPSILKKEKGFREKLSNTCNEL